MTREIILIVEDEPLVGIELKEGLERLGYTVPEVLDSGEEVFEAVARYKPDLLLMDVRLQGCLDGIEAAYQAKAEFDTPVIYLSAYSDAETLNRAARTGPDAFLLKPFDERELAANVKIALARAKNGEARRRELRGAMTLIDALEDPALIAGEDGKVVHVNAAGARLLNIADSSALASVELSRLLDQTEGGSPFLDLALRRIGSGGSLSKIAKAQKLRRFDGREYGTLVLLDAIEKKEGHLLAESAAEANAMLQSFLPGPDSAGPGYRVAGFLDPCLSGSGDLFDVFSVGEGKTAFYGLDIMGHGVVTSLMAFSLHDAVPALGRGFDGRSLEPAELIDALCERYCRDDSPGSSFFSIAYGVIDGATGKYRVARGGYTPVLRLDADGSMQVHHSAGSAVGVSDCAEVEEVGGVLSPGARLILASDGLLQSFGGEGLLVQSLERLGSFAEACQGMSLEDFVGAFRLRSREDSLNRTSVDDVSLLVIERIPPR